MDNIDTVIEKLVNIGKNYPQKRGGLGIVDWCRGHHDQDQAQYLVNLGKVSELSAADKKLLVMHVITRLYRELDEKLDKPSFFLRQIHQCLLNGEDFKEYKSHFNTLEEMLKNGCCDYLVEIPFPVYTESAKIGIWRESAVKEPVFDLSEGGSYELNPMSSSV